VYSGDHFGEHFAEPQKVETVQSEVTDAIDDMQMDRYAISVEVHGLEEGNTLVLSAILLDRAPTVTDLVSSKNDPSEKEDQHEDQCVEQEKSGIGGRQLRFVLPC
jgi:hypothetical protein